MSKSSYWQGYLTKKSRGKVRLGVRTKDDWYVVKEGKLHGYRYMNVSIRPLSRPFLFFFFFFG